MKAEIGRKLWQGGLGGGGEAGGVIDLGIVRQAYFPSLGVDFVAVGQCMPSFFSSVILRHFHDKVDKKYDTTFVWELKSGCTEIGRGRYDFR